jgi:ABC-type antimicrobial peptide transport system permease subunit
MKKNLKIIGIIFIVIIILLIILGMYKFNYLSGKTGYDVDGNKISSDYKNTSYIINGENVKLVDGISEIEIAPDSASKIITKYFGNEIKKDLDSDGREDTVFLLTEESGGSGTFFYVVAALNTENGDKGSYGVFLGDRITPQNIESGPGNSIIVNYLERKQGEPMSTEPQVTKSLRLILDSTTMQFGEVS